MPSPTMPGLHEVVKVPALAVLLLSSHDVSVALTVIGPPAPPAAVDPAVAVGLSAQPVRARAATSDRATGTAVRTARAAGRRAGRGMVVLLEGVGVSAKRTGRAGRRETVRRRRWDARRSSGSRWGPAAPGRPGRPAEPGAGRGSGRCRRRAPTRWPGARWSRA